LKHTCHLPHQLWYAFARRRRDREYLESSLAEPHRDLVEPLSHLRYVDLVQRDHLRPLRKVRIVQRDLGIYFLEVLERIDRSSVNDMNQHLCPLDVPQELMPKTNSSMGALDQAGNVGNDEAIF